MVRLARQYTVKCWLAVLSRLPPCKAPQNVEVSKLKSKAKLHSTCLYF